MFKTILAKIRKDPVSTNPNTAVIEAALKENQALLKKILDD